MRTDEGLGLAHSAAEELETVVSELSWNLMTPPERQDVIAAPEQLSRYFRGIDTRRSIGWTSWPLWNRGSLSPVTRISI